MAAPATDHERFMKIRQKRQVGYLHLPVCTYSCMAGRRWEVGEKATNDITYGSRITAECVRMHTSTEAWVPAERGDPHFVGWNSAPSQFGVGSFDLNSLSKI